MEAIAYWMHCQAGAAGRAERAVVPYEDLHAFLAKHIRDVEKTYDPKGDPEDLAQEFLEFVKRRAGLLVELGEGKYSFVHLTFQEYLASTNVITVSEKGGAENLWDLLRERCGDPRWNEVIRLLVAGLRSEDSQRFLIESIFAQKNRKQLDGHLSLLLGGLLLDGIDHAQLRAREILTALLDMSQAARETEGIVSATSVLSTWLRKEESQASVLDEALSGLQHARKGDHQSALRLALTRYAISWPSAKQSALSPGSFLTNERLRALLELFFGDGSEAQRLAPIAENMAGFSEVLLPLLFDSPDTNFVASCCQAVTWAVPPLARAKGHFERLLELLLNIGYKGPLFYYVFNSLRIADPRFNRGQVPDVAGLEHGDREFGLEKAVAGALGPRRSRAARRSAFAAADPYIQAIHRVARRESPPFAAWPDVLLDPARYNSILEFLTRYFSLRPKAQWREALRVGFLPDIPRRLGLFNQSSWEAVEDALWRDTKDEADLFNGAFLLMLDAVLYIYRVHSSKQESRLRRLSQVTRDLGHPALVLAHRLRDIAYGVAVTTSDLRAAFGALSTSGVKVWWLDWSSHEVHLVGSTDGGTPAVAHDSTVSTEAVDGQQQGTEPAE